MKPTKPKAYSYIRFSTPEQAEGDSERRQIEAANDYAKDKFELVPLRDMGVSGYSGKHISKGELGKFLDKIEKGEITSGSRLIIESVDRLTRLEPSEAQTLLISILKAHIVLVVLDYGSQEITLQKYNNEPGIFYQLMGEIQRAYQESKRKSDILTSTRKNEREQAREGKKLISGMPPMWLKFNEDNTDFIIQEDIVEVIKLMFQMKANRKGAYCIERELNQMEDIYHPNTKRNKSGKWRKSTINRYLKDRRLLGEYQPKKYINKEDGTREREKAGKLIPNYYPQVIDQKLFDRVKAVFEANSKRAGNAGGRADKYNNLFTHLVKCSNCGDSMRYIDKGGGRPKLRCDNNARGLECNESRKVRYDIAEPMLLNYCHGLDPSDIMPGNEKRQTELTNTQNELQEVQGALSRMRETYERVYQDNKHEKHDRLRENTREDLRKQLDEIEELEEKESNLQSRINELSNATESTAQRIIDIKELVERLEEVEGKARIDLRIALRSKLQRLIDQIKVGFWADKDDGFTYTTFEIDFKDNVLRTLVLINDKLNEVMTIKDGDIEMEDIQRERQKESNRRVAKGLSQAQEATG